MVWNKFLLAQLNLGEIFRYYLVCSVGIYYGRMFIFWDYSTDGVLQKRRAGAQDRGGD